MASTISVLWRQYSGDNRQGRRSRKAVASSAGPRQKSTLLRRWRNRAHSARATARGERIIIRRVSIANPRPGGEAIGYLFFHGKATVFGPIRMFRFRVMWTRELGAQISSVARTPVSPKIRME